MRFSMEAIGHKRYLPPITPPVHKKFRKISYSDDRQKTMENAVLSSKKQKIILAVLALAVVFTLLYLSARPDGRLHVYFLDVGQGDAILLRTPSGKNILIDGGEGKAVLTQLNEVLPFLDSKLDYIMITHPHKDHIEGVTYALGKYPAGQIFYNGDLTKSYLLNIFLKTAKEKQIPIAIVNENSDFALKDGVFFDFLFPLEGEDLSKYDTNNKSLVVEVIYDENKLLFTGDAEGPVEERLLKEHVDMDVDLLKVGHHGSRNASTEEFLKQVSPTYCVISVGDNNTYGHPHKEAMERLANHCQKIMRTDKSGRIELVF